MDEPKRYDCDYTGKGDTVDMVERACGEYVRYEDYKATIAVLLEFWHAWQEHHYDPSVGSLHRLNLAERACMGQVPSAKADESVKDPLATEGREIISRRSYAVGDPTIGVSFNRKPPQMHDMLHPGEMVVIYGIPGSARREGASSET